MKALSTLVMVFLMSFPLFAQIENSMLVIEAPDEIENVVMYYDNGVLHQEGFIKNEKAHGDWKWYDRNGNLIAEALYNNGDKVGKWYFWDNGEKTEVDYNKNQIAQIKVFNKEGTEVVSN